MAQATLHYQVPLTFQGTVLGFRALCQEAAHARWKQVKLTSNPSLATCKECRAIYEEALTKCQNSTATAEGPQSGDIA